MAISSSLATKAGAAGTLVAGTGLGGTYLAWDHITLYAVEREVINKDIKLTVTAATNNASPITIAVDDESKGKLTSGYSWTCEISVEGTDTTKYISNLVSRLKNNLPTTTETSHKNQKLLLVKGCAGKRDVDQTTKSIKGKLKLKQKKANNFEFENYSVLEDLLSFNLKPVEEEVIKKNVKLKVDGPTTGNTSLKVSVDSESKVKLTSGYSWDCEITLDNGVSSQHDNLKNKINGKLPTSDSISGTQLEDKEFFVKACSQSRKDNPTDTTVVGKLTIKNGEGSTQVFENRPELDDWLK